MARNRLRRKLRRINEGPAPPREAPGLACLGFAAAALAATPGDVAPLPALAACALGVAWLRGHRTARPRAAAIASHLAIGAFIGACSAAVLIDPPATARAWLQWPAARGGPAVALVLAAALVEDLGRSALRALGRARSPRPPG